MYSRKNGGKSKKMPAPPRIFWRALGSPAGSDYIAGSCANASLLGDCPTVMPDPAQPPRVMEIDCPSCGERLTTRADNAGKRIHCPVCSDQLTVPLRTSERLPDDPLLAVDSPRVFSPAGPSASAGSSSAAGATDNPADVEADNGDTYSLLPNDPLPAAPPSAAYRRAVEQLDEEEAARQAERERWQFGPRREQDSVAAADAPPASRTVLGTTPPPPSVAGDDYAIEPIPPPEERPAGEEPLAYRLAKERLAQEEADQPEVLAEPPLWPFVSGVLTYPWSRDLLLPWATASGGAVATGILLQLAFFTFTLGGLWHVATVFCCIALAAAAVVTGSYLAVYALSIVENTAAGLDELATAPDTSMAERIKPSGFVMFLLWVASLPGFAVGYLLLQHVFGVFFGLVAPTLFVAFLMFPVLLLSTLEGASIFQLLSPPIARSLRENGRLWFGFYLASGGALFVGLGLSFALYLIPYVGPILAGPLFVAVLLIYARTIGRLAWLVAFKSAKKSAKK